MIQLSQHQLKMCLTNGVIGLVQLYAWISVQLLELRKTVINQHSLNHTLNNEVIPPFKSNETCTYPWKTFSYTMSVGKVKLGVKHNI